MLEDDRLVVSLDYTAASLLRWVGDDTLLLLLKGTSWGGGLISLITESFFATLGGETAFGDLTIWLLFLLFSVTLEMMAPLSDAFETTLMILDYSTLMF